MADYFLDIGRRDYFVTDSTTAQKSKQETPPVMQVDALSLAKRDFERRFAEYSTTVHKAVKRRYAIK